MICWSGERPRPSRILRWFTGSTIIFLAATRSAFAQFPPSVTLSAEPGQPLIELRGQEQRLNF